MCSSCFWPIVSAAECRSYWVAHMETVPGYQCCPFHSFSCHSVKGQVTKGTRKQNRTLPHSTRIGNQLIHITCFLARLNWVILKLGQRLFFVLFCFVCSKTPPAKFNYLLFWGVREELPVICYLDWNFRKIVTSVDFSGWAPGNRPQCQTLNWRKKSLYSWVAKDLYLQRYDF